MVGLTDNPAQGSPTICLTQLHTGNAFRGKGLSFKYRKAISVLTGSIEPGRRNIQRISRDIQSVTVCKHSVTAEVLKLRPASRMLTSYVFSAVRVLLMNTWRDTCTTEVKAGIVGLLVYNSKFLMLIEWDYVSELQSSTGLLFIQQVTSPLQRPICWRCSRE
jgi:hypothetical protein